MDNSQAVVSISWLLLCCLLATLFCAKIKLLLRFGPVGSGLAWTGGVRSRLVLGTSVRFGSVWTGGFRSRLVRLGCWTLTVERFNEP